MRIATSLALTILVAVVSGARALGGDPGFARAAADPASGIEDDLVLVLVPMGKLEVRAGSSFEFSWNIWNLSDTEAYPVVLPRHGSLQGWREPGVKAVLEMLHDDGSVTPIDTRTVGCGTHDRDWRRDVTWIAPGERVELTSTPRAPGWALQEPGRYRIRAEYTYGRAPERLEDAGEMTGVPSFRLEAEPIEFTVVRPWDLEVRIVTDEWLPGSLHDLRTELEIFAVTRETGQRSRLKEAMIWIGERSPDRWKLGWRFTARRVLLRQHPILSPPYSPGYTRSFERLPETIEGPLYVRVIEPQSGLISAPFELPIRWNYVEARRSQ